METSNHLWSNQALKRLPAVKQTHAKYVLINRSIQHYVYSLLEVNQIIRALKAKDLVF